MNRAISRLRRNEPSSGDHDGSRLLLPILAAGCSTVLVQRATRCMAAGVSVVSLLTEGSLLKGWQCKGMLADTTVHGVA